MDRYLINSNGPTIQAVRKALSILVQQASAKNTKVRAVLLNPTKKLKGSVIWDVLGEAVCNLLEKGHNVKVTENCTLTLESPKTFGAYTPVELIVAMYLKGEVIETSAEASRYASTLIVVPWKAEEIEIWKVNRQPHEVNP